MLYRFGRVTTIWYNPLYDTHIHCRLVVVCVWNEFHVQHPETYTYKKTRCLCMTVWWHIDHCSCSSSSSYLSTHCNTFPTHHTLLILLQAVFTSFRRWRTDWKAATSRKTDVALSTIAGGCTFWFPEMSDGRSVDFFTWIHTCKESY